ncbi:MAG: methyl-coenzyme M reductase I operon protein C [Candidatus Nezhaarchaeota archaeon]|nr:methyl-coenzyme M reductase I operon protein C [Candidatus Nezhaarchaeota archaeon]
MRIGRKTHIVNCRRTMSLKTGGGLAQSGTIARAMRPEVIVIAMSPSKRHVTKPVCEITYALRAANIDVSVLVLNKGGGGAPDSPSAGAPGANVCFLEEEEVLEINKHKLAILHLGSIKEHVVYKARFFLRYIAIPTVVVCQAPVDFEDFAKRGIKTRVVRPPVGKEESLGEIYDVVTGVIRGISVAHHKIDEITSKVKEALIYVKGATRNA